MQDDITSSTSAKEKSRKYLRLGIWLKRALVLSLLLTLPIAYYLAYISKDWINRIGIIMNFAAGFMLAPELIGVSRLRKIEIIVEIVLSNQRQLLTRATEKIQDFFAITKGRLTFGLAVIAGIILLIVITEKSLLLRYIFIWIICVFVVGLLGAIYALIKGRKDEIFDGFMASFVLVYAITYPALPSIGIALLYPILGIIIAIINATGYVLKRLSGDDRLRSILIYWGILLFITGNLLQFLSTF